MERISEILGDAKTIGIAGHVRPDGDCVGSCMGLYLYLKQEYPQLEVDIYLDHPKHDFYYIEGMQEIRMEADESKVYDLFVTCDVSSKDRIGVAMACFDSARRTYCIDHHISNTGFADDNYVRGEISSASEVLYTLLDPQKVTRPVAEAIYTGIIHDTGVFQYSSTTPQTMEIAGRLMATGFDFSKIIDESFFEKTYIQNQVMGRVLTESILFFEGKCIAGILRRKDLDFYGITGKDLDGIVSQLRLTKGVQVAIFIYEFETMRFKVSLRSNEKVDVSKVAVYFGGGGHARAAGCDMSGTAYDVLNNLSEQIEKQLLQENAEA